MRMNALAERAFIFLVFVGALLTAGDGSAAAKTSKPKSAMAPMAAPMNAAATNPACAYQPIDVDKYGKQPYADAPVIHSKDGNLTATLDIGYTDTNKVSIAGCPLHLRSYNGALIGPTLRAKPGDWLRVTVKNDLPGPGHTEHCNLDGTFDKNHKMIMGPDVYDVSNLHTHGLHVSPSGNSDNVFIEICPGQSKDFAIHIPPNHPAGTFWYHAHVHGSTALQVSSGMEGALIIEGGLDDVPEIKAAQEKTFLLQQTSYDESGQIESSSVFGPSSWAASQRYITVNGGQIAPVFTMHPGEVQRWRFIHGGVRETVELFSTGGPLYEIATDGNTMGRIDTWKSPIELEPGYRSDVLFKAPPLAGGQTSTRYYIMTGPIAAQNRLSFLTIPNRPEQLTAELNTSEPPQIIAVIDVEGTPQDMALPTDGELASLAPYKDITPEELTGQEQHVSFSIENHIDCSRPGKCQPCPTCNVFQFMVDHYSFPNSPVRTLKLGTASRWTLEVYKDSAGPEHPFHIHVNPFEMVRVGPDGNDETVWKDTLMVHQTGMALKYRQVLSRYEDFDGVFVLHCHILDHEDGGMMQAVEIAH